MKRPLLCAFLILLTWPATTWAFCGFFVAPGDTKLVNNATSVALMRHEKTTVMSLQPDYQGPVEEFALVIPVPEILDKDRVKTLDPSMFDAIDEFSSPRMAEYWEQDPCHQGVDRLLNYTDKVGKPATKISNLMGVGKPFVKVEAQFAVGEYDIVILNSNDATALEGWLVDQKYKIPKGAAPYLAPYIASGKYFFVAKVDPKRARFNGENAVLSPLRFHFTSEDFSLPIRLGMINAEGEQDIIIFILGDGRYVPANYPHAPIPTNIVVNNEVRDQFAGFYEGLYQKARKENEDAIITEYVWEVANIQPKRGTIQQTGKCDPCTSPTQFFQPLWAMSLGLDVFGITGTGQSGGDPFGMDSKRVEVEPRENTISAPSKLTLTRLHGRFKASDKNADIFFQKAVPLVGGMGSPDQDSKLAETKQMSSGLNRFQGRYVMLNKWEGKLECKEPTRGKWGGPSSRADARKPKPTAGGVRFGGKKQKALKPDKFTKTKIKYTPPAAPQY